MKQKTYLQLVAAIFFVIGVLHLYRAVRGFEVVIVNLHISATWSWLGALVAFSLAYLGYKHSR